MNIFSHGEEREEEEEEDPAGTRDSAALTFARGGRGEDVDHARTRRPCIAVRWA